jgi:hypothetical protein
MKSSLASDTTITTSLPVRLFRSRGLQTDEEIVEAKEFKDESSQTETLESCYSLSSGKMVSVVNPLTCQMNSSLTSSPVDIKEDISSIKSNKGRSRKSSLVPRLSLGDSPSEEVSQSIREKHDEQESLLLQEEDKTRKSSLTSSSCHCHNHSHHPSQSIHIFYANELARREVELAEARLRAKELECSLRELNWASSVDKFRLKAKVTEFERLQSQRSAVQSAVKPSASDNSSTVKLLYVKNVVDKFSKTNDKNQQKIMLSALMTALDLNET